ncbi:MAG: PorT family protein [Flavobacteriales bacterium]|nr:PorT family protein [Flavobacteriales bacterium]
MKKFLALAILAVIFDLSSKAQDFKFGVKANAGMSNLSNVAGAEFKESIGGGLFASFKFAVVGVQADVLYQNFGYGATGYKLPVSYVQIPIVGKFHFLPFLNLQAGPYYGFFLAEGDDPDVYKESAFNKSDFGAVFGVGAQFWRIHVDARYVMGFTEVIDPLVAGAGVKNQAIMLGAGFALVK